MSKKTPSIDTQVIHGGSSGDPLTGAVKTPIYQTVGYRFQDAQQAADLFNMDREGFLYTRLGNPTVQAMEQRIAELEGGIGAVATASGIAANLLALYPLMESGCEFVASSRLYGGSLSQFMHAFKKFGWICRLVDADDPENFARITNEKTRAYFCENQSNPLSQICDVEAIARIAHNHGVPLIVDNTIPTPYLWRPFEWGADIIVHSTTKFLNGHGNSVGGIVVDSGNFDWVAAGKYPDLTGLPITTGCVSDHGGNQNSGCAYGPSRIQYFGCCRVSRETSQGSFCFLSRFTIELLLSISPKVYAARSQCFVYL
jgi:O-acetylhomoserine (thiol)-lyase